MTLEERIRAAMATHPDDNELRLVVGAYTKAFTEYKDGGRDKADYNHLIKVKKDLKAVLDSLPAPEVSQSWPDVLENVNQVHQYLTDQGYKVRSRQTIYNHVRKYALIKRQDGRFDRATVDAYARAVNLEREQDLTPAQAARPAIRPPEAGEDKTLIELKREKEAELVTKARLDNKEKMAALVDILIVEREQQELCQAVRMHLSPLVRSTAERVLSLIGGDPSTAREVIDLVGGDPDAVDKLCTWVMGRKPELIAMYKPHLKAALNAFATGSWYTPEMAEAWTTYLRQREDAELDDIKALIGMAGGDKDRAGEVLERFCVRRME